MRRIEEQRDRRECRWLSIHQEVVEKPMTSENAFDRREKCTTRQGFVRACVVVREPFKVFERCLCEQVSKFHESCSGTRARESVAIAPRRRRQVLVWSRPDR